MSAVIAMAMQQLGVSTIRIDDSGRAGCNMMLCAGRLFNCCAFASTPAQAQLFGFQSIDGVLEPMISYEVANGPQFTRPNPAGNRPILIRKPI
jgi:hypothetical protein